MKLPLAIPKSKVGACLKPLFVCMLQKKIMAVVSRQPPCLFFYQIPLPSASHLTLESSKELKNNQYAILLSE